MSDIPLEICREILLRLPAESVIPLRAVCKGWQAVIEDPSFARAHIKKQHSPNTLLLRNSTGPPRYPLYYFDSEALHFTNGSQTIPVTPLKLTRSGLLRLPCFPVSACNGLLLISPLDHEEHRRRDFWDGKGSWEIWNPLTHERLKLPRLDINPCVLGYGIGYDCAADDYKVVVIENLNRVKKFGCQTYVYSLKLDSWRKIEGRPLEFINNTQMDLRGAFLNGALHWLKWNKIIAFDLETAKYRQLELPSLVETTTDKTRLDALSGCLFLSYYDGSGHHGWVLNDYGAGDSWMKLFSFNKNDNDACREVRPVAYMKDKKQVVLQHDRGLLWFDVESNSLKTVCVHGLSVDFEIFSQNCVGSLFRLHDSCGSVVANKRRTSKKKKNITTLVDTKLTFCVRDYDTNSFNQSHDSCYSSD